MNITITQKDLEKYDISSDSGMVIDALAYAAKQWTSNDLWLENTEYEPTEPYNYNYEDDLFKATKTANKLYKLAQSLNVSLNANWERISKEQKLQAGATVALNNPEEWKNLLEAYTEKLKDDKEGGISKDYNKALEEELKDYEDRQYKEWLYGDYRDYAGVVKKIAKYFTDSHEGEYAPKADEYTFTLNETDIENFKDKGYKKNQLKSALLDDIKSSTNARYEKEKAEREKRKAERERVAIYKKEQAEEEAKERKAKLLLMKLNK